MGASVVPVIQWSAVGGTSIWSLRSLPQQAPALRSSTIRLCTVVNSLCRCPLRVLARVSYYAGLSHGGPWRSCHGKNEVTMHTSLSHIVARCSPLPAVPSVATHALA